MISLYAAMLVTLGFLIAALLVVVVLPAYRHRIERFTTEALKRTLPLTEVEIRADKDRLRAEFAIEVHKLESKLGDATLSAARQNVEISRRDAKIQELTLAISDHKMSVEEHENARRVLEQAILDRLPKVEQRLAETRKLLSVRDREIADLLESSSKQANALEQATQLNVQREQEVTQLRMAVETRAARNREAVGDARFDAEVATKSELEALRAQTGDQARMIERLQASAAQPAVDKEAEEAREKETARLKSKLAAVESELAALKAAEGESDDETAKLRAKVSELESEIGVAAIETAKLKATLKSLETPDEEAPSITQKAAVTALQTEVDEQRRLIEAMKAEISEGQERLVRQAQHFRDEIRRLGSEPPRDAMAAAEATRRSLAERLVTPRPARHDADAKPSEPRPAAYLRAVNGGENGNSVEASPPPLPASEEPQAPRPIRRPRLLERISGLEKT